MAWMANRRAVCQDCHNVGLAHYSQQAEQGFLPGSDFLGLDVEQLLLLRPKQHQHVAQRRDPGQQDTSTQENERR